MRGRQLAAALLAISVALTAWLVVGSYVTYTHQVTATEIQNIYIERITWFSGAIGVLQVAAIVSLMVGGK